MIVQVVLNLGGCIYSYWLYLFVLVVFIRTGCIYSYWLYLVVLVVLNRVVVISRPVRTSDYHVEPAHRCPLGETPGQRLHLPASRFPDTA